MTSTECDAEVNCKNWPAVDGTMYQDQREQVFCCLVAVAAVARLYLEHD